MTWDLPVTCKTPLLLDEYKGQTYLSLNLLESASSSSLQTQVSFAVFSEFKQITKNPNSSSSYILDPKLFKNSNQQSFWYLINWQAISWTSLGFGQNKQSSSCQSHLTDQSETRVAFCEQKVQFEHLLCTTTKGKTSKRLKSHWIWL